MAPESVTIAPPIREATLPRCKLRFRFAKTGDLRLVSHHDLMHVFERLMRRAEVPFALSQGFHPMPRMSFPLSLALGVAGTSEVVDLELTDVLDGDEVLARLNAKAPEGLTFLSAQPLTGKKSGQVRRVGYRLWLPSSVDDLSKRIHDFLVSPECWIVRTRPHRRRINLRSFVCELSASSGLPQGSRCPPCGEDDAARSCLQMILWVSPAVGAARPDEIIVALGLGRLLDEGPLLERTLVELIDEVPPGERPLPDLGAAVSAAPPQTMNDTTPADDEPPGSTLSTTLKNHAPTSLVDNPLSFDS